MNSLSGKVGALTSTVTDLVTTVENLAISTKRGFDSTATKEDMDAGFKEVNARLDRIESTVTGHGNRIDRVVDDVRLVKTKVGMQ